MAKRVFFSFHYKPDNWRAGQVRNIGIVEGNKPVEDNTWESVISRGEAAIQSWIDTNMAGRVCTLVLIGQNTADRKWINYEIRKTWLSGMGLVGIYIHGLKDILGKQATKGQNPFNGIYVSGTNLLNTVRAYDPPYSISENVYDYIKKNINPWVDEAIRIRNAN